MADEMDAYQYLGFLTRRWRFIALACAVAVSGALLLCLLVPRKYTATSRVLIEPPAGADPRGAMSVSPIYLESLKTYEHFASGDSLFSRAADKYHLRELYGSRALESLKQSVLKVSIPRNTKILEISVTLPDPKLANTLALYLAEETVNLNRAVIADQDREVTETVQKQYAEARASLEAAESAWSRAASKEPVQSLQAEVAAQQETMARLKRQLLATEVEVADYSSRSRTDWMGDAQARAAELRKQLADVETPLHRNESVLAERIAKLTKLEETRKSAQAAVLQLENRVRDIQGAAGYRGERLKIIDPGIVPERPSSPQPLLYTLGALLVALLGSLVFLSIEFSYRRSGAYSPEKSPDEFATRRHDWHSSDAA
jgi:uncharacterized protein involved in exopolysaccharide biosynthesis